MFDLDNLIEESFAEDVAEIVCEEHHKSPVVIYDSKTSELTVSGCCDRVVDRALQAIDPD